MLDCTLCPSAMKTGARPGDATVERLRWIVAGCWILGRYRHGNVPDLPDRDCQAGAAMPGASSWPNHPPIAGTRALTIGAGSVSCMCEGLN
jgi:hypothetical protein